MAEASSGAPSRPSVETVLDGMGVLDRTVDVLRDDPAGNGNWLVSPTAARPFVLRRHHAQTTIEDLRYEHNVLEHVARAGWHVPVPVGEPLLVEGWWYCPTQYVAGVPVPNPSTDPAEQARRGRDLARLHVVLRGLEATLGQRPGWRALHTASSVHTWIDWERSVDAFDAVDRRLAAWAAAAASAAGAALGAIGASGLPVMVVHGDFTEWNVLYDDGALAGVIDFALTHVDSRPFELAIARSYRQPAMIEGYRSELLRSGWPLSELEEAAIVPMQRAFRVDMVAWQLDQGERTGRYDLAMIERQLERSGTSPP